MKKHFLASFVMSLAITSFSQVQINNSTQLVASGNVQLVFEDLSFVNNGTFLPATSIANFTGSLNTTISGNSATGFYDLLLNKPVGRLSLQQHIDVSGNISFVSGLLDLNNFNLSLAPASLLNGENENTRITGTNGGYLQITANLNAPAAVNPGNLGAVITSSRNLGNTIIRRGHTVQSGSNNPGFSIQRYYDLLPASNTLLNAELKFNYFNAELNGKTEADLWLWKTQNFSDWFASAETDLRDPVANFISARNINSFPSRWTLGHASFPQSVNGPCDDKIVLKAWPNPFTNDFNVGINAAKAGSATLQLYDITGKRIAVKQITLREGSNLYNFSFPEIPAGVYVIKITDSGCTTTLGKIIKH